MNNFNNNIYGRPSSKLEEECQNEINEIDEWVDSYNETVLNDPMMSEEDKQFFLRMNEHDRWKGREQAKEKYEEEKLNLRIHHKEAKRLRDMELHDNMISQESPSWLKRVLSSVGSYYLLKKIFGLSLVLLILSCANKNKHELPNSDTEIGWGEEYLKEQNDSLIKEKDTIKEKKDENVSEPDKKSSLSSSSHSYYNSEEVDSHHETDNMRGFDPASEDDMPDNGMSRYMENNDEEGWD